MSMEHRLNIWINPKLHLTISILVSFFTASIVFRAVELEAETLRTFLIFYVLLGILSLVFSFREKFINEVTQQLMQFSFILLGSALMISGVISFLGKSLSVSALFFLILFLPGAAIFRAGIHFKKGKVK